MLAGKPGFVAREQTQQAKIAAWGEHAVGFGRDRMMADHPPDGRVCHQPRPCVRNFVRQQVGTRAVADDVCVVTGVAGEDDGAVVIAVDIVKKSGVEGEADMPTALLNRRD